MKIASVAQHCADFGNLAEHIERLGGEKATSGAMDLIAEGMHRSMLADAEERTILFVSPRWDLALEGSRAELTAAGR